MVTSAIPCEGSHVSEPQAGIASACGFQRPATHLAVPGQPAQPPLAGKGLWAGVGGAGAMRARFATALDVFGSRRTAHTRTR